MKIVIILPTYNEKGNIERLIQILEEKILPQVKDHSISILVADDSSPDGTANEVKRLMKKWGNLDLSIGEKNGLGAAYIRGMTYAIEKMEAEVVFEMDADFFHDPYKVPDFIKKIDEGYDFVVGTRYSNGGSIPTNWGLHRKIFSVFGNFLVRTILGRFSIHDWTGGYRAVKKEVFFEEKEELRKFKGYTFQVAFLYMAIRDGYKIAEVPFHATDRVLGRSKIAPLEYIIDLLKYVISARILELKRFIKFLIVGGTGFVLQISTQEISVRSGFAQIIAFIISPIIFSFTQHHGMIAIRDAVGGGFGAETAVISNFMFNNFWTFKDARKLKEKSPFIIRLLKFNLTSFGSIFLQATSIWLFVRLLGEHIAFLSYVIPTRVVVVIPTIIFLVIPLNYFVYNKIIWKTQYLKHGKTA